MIEKGGKVDWVGYYKGFGKQEVRYPSKREPNFMYYWLPGCPGSNPGKLNSKVLVREFLQKHQVWPSQDLDVTIR